MSHSPLFCSQNIEFGEGGHTTDPSRLLMFTEAAYLMRTRTLIHQAPRIRTPIHTSSTRVGSAARLTPGRTQARDHMLVARILIRTLTAICTRLLQGWERGDITILRLHRSLNINLPRTMLRVPLPDRTLQSSRNGSQDAPCARRKNEKRTIG